MDELTLDEALAELSSAEDFLEYFGIAYVPEVVQVNRLHILQRFHDYIAQSGPEPRDDEARYGFYAGLLAQAYEDFVCSNALTEKVFKVFHRHGPHTAFVPITAITMGGPPTVAESGGRDCGGTGECQGAKVVLPADD